MSHLIFFLIPQDVPYLYICKIVILSESLFLNIEFVFFACPESFPIQFFHFSPFILYQLFPYTVVLF
jgi:hypothetical protein